MEMRERQTIEVECLHLIATFYHHVDNFEDEQLTALFAPDAVFIRRQNKFHGQADILAAHAARPRDRITRHVSTNIVVDVIDGHHATGRSYCLIYAYPELPKAGEMLPMPAPREFGEWHDEFILTDAGWKFARRQLTSVFGGS